MLGLGTLHHPVSTKNTEAQRFFDQGLTFIYAFNHDEAIRSLFGLMESLKARGKTYDAQMVRREFEVAWRNADTKLRLEDL